MLQTRKSNAVSHDGSIVKKEVNSHLQRMGLSPEEEDSLLEEGVKDKVIKANDTQAERTAFTKVPDVPAAPAVVNLRAEAAAVAATGKKGPHNAFE